MQSHLRVLLKEQSDEVPHWLTFLQYIVPESSTSKGKTSTTKAVPKPMTIIVYYLQ